MKVKELIEKLQQFPEDMEVFCDEVACTGNKFKYLAHEPTVTEERFVKNQKDILIVQRPCKETSGAKKCLVI
jgi:hypothetical protein